MCRCPCRGRPAPNRRSRSRAGTRAPARSASAVLPVQVGPIRQTASGPAGGTPSDICHRPRRNNRSSSFMPTNDQVGRPCTHWSLRTVCFHLAQQRVHLRTRQVAIGPHGLVARHRAERAIERVAEQPRSPCARRSAIMSLHAAWRLDVRAAAPGSRAPAVAPGLRASTSIPRRREQIQRGLGFVGIGRRDAVTTSTAAAGSPTV